MGVTFRVPTTKPLNMPHTIPIRTATIQPEEYRHLRMVELKQRDTHPRQGHDAGNGDIDPSADNHDHLSRSQKDKHTVVAGIFISDPRNTDPG